MRSRIRPVRSWCVIVSLVAASASAQTARQVRGAAAVEPLQNEPAAKIVIDPPLDGPLSRGRVVIQYRTENLHMAPVFGPAALAVSPRIGHIHVSVDDASWVWVDASGEPVILDGLPPGTHQVRIELENANHQQLDQGTVKFKVPDVEVHAAPPGMPVLNEPPARLIVDSPGAEPLARGVLFIPYRPENVTIVPVFGPAALAVSPRVGHIHVTVDSAPWHWVDASGVPVIINGLSPGPHKLLIQLVNANHQSIDQGSIEVTVPAAKPHLEAH